MIEEQGAGESPRGDGPAFDRPDPKILDRFPNPATPDNSAGGIEISIRAPEFTCVCPMTRQPDFATIAIRYEPGEWCVESKSLKLYLMGYRNHGAFHEAVVNRIGNDLVELLDPVGLEVSGEFMPRGGISFWPRFTYRSTS